MPSRETFPFGRSAMRERKCVASLFWSMDKSNWVKAWGGEKVTASICTQHQGHFTRSTRARPPLAPPVGKRVVHGRSPSFIGQFTSRVNRVFPTVTHLSLSARSRIAWHKTSRATLETLSNRNARALVKPGEPSLGDSLTQHPETPK